MAARAFGPLHHLCRWLRRPLALPSSKTERGGRRLPVGTRNGRVRTKLIEGPERKGPVMTDQKPQIRHAATVIVLRDAQREPKVLMGQRGAKAAFMPNKFVFPGGAADADDAHIPLGRPLSDDCTSRLKEDPTEGIPPIVPQTLAIAAIRELYEETGQILADGSPWPDAPTPWDAFAPFGKPDASGRTFVFRALTPPGRPRRFDARFFLVDAENLASNPDDLLEAARRANLPANSVIELSGQIDPDAIINPK